MVPSFDFTSVDINGVELAYVDQGSGDPVVFVHGAGATDFRTWSGQIAFFAQHCRVIAYSQRYHWPNSPEGIGPDVYSTEQQTADLAALVETIGLEPAHIVGNSFGGDITLVFGHRFPQYTRSLVLAEPGLSAWLPDLPGGKELEDTYFESMEPAMEAIEQGDLDHAARLFIEAVSGPGVYDELPPSAHQRLRDNVFILAFETPGFDDTPLQCADVGTIEAPAILLTGDSSPPEFGMVAEELARCMPSIERAVIPDASHVMQVMNPDVFNETVLDFLARH
jgi:non-heme chloroperoxidase